MFVPCCWSLPGITSKIDRLTGFVLLYIQFGRESISRGLAGCTPWGWVNTYIHTYLRYCIGGGGLSVGKCHGDRLIIHIGYKQVCELKKVIELSPRPDLLPQSK